MLLYWLIVVLQFLGTGVSSGRSGIRGPPGLDRPRVTAPSGYSQKIPACAKDMARASGPHRVMR